MKETSLKSFARKLANNLPEKWNVEVDEQSIESTNGHQAGFRRDDLCSFIIEVQDDSFPPESMYVHIPNEVSSIPDRPGNPMVEVKPSVTNVTQTIRNKIPEYEGEFEYDS